MGPVCSLQPTARVVRGRIACLPQEADHVHAPGFFGRMTHPVLRLDQIGGQLRAKLDEGCVARRQHPREKWAETQVPTYLTTLSLSERIHSAVDRAGPTGTGPAIGALPHRSGEPALAGEVPCCMRAGGGDRRSRLVAAVDQSGHNLAHHAQARRGDLVGRVLWSVPVSVVEIDDGDSLDANFV